MELGEFRKLTKNLPDNTEVTVCDGIDTFEVYNHFGLYPPTTDYTTLIMLDMGQIVELQFDLENREASRTLQD
jgi:hypothetical protein